MYVSWTYVIQQVSGAVSTVPTPDSFFFAFYRMDIITNNIWRALSGTLAAGELIMTAEGTRPRKKVDRTDHSFRLRSAKFL